MSLFSWFVTFCHPVVGCLVIITLTFLGVVALLFDIVFLPTVVVFVTAINYNNWFNTCTFRFSNKSIHNYW